MNNTTDSFTLSVCGLHELEYFGDAGITDLVSCLPREHLDGKLAWRPTRSHVLFEFDDVEEPSAYHRHPTREDVEHAIALGHYWRSVVERGCPVRILVHCHAGISRSTAMALTWIVQRLGPGREAEAVNELLDMRPGAWPNPLIVDHADEILGCDGRLIDAVTGHKELMRGRAKQIYEERVRFIRGSHDLIERHQLQQPNHQDGGKTS